MRPYHTLTVPSLFPPCGGRLRWGEPIKTLHRTGCHRPDDILHSVILLKGHCQTIKLVPLFGPKCSRASKLVHIGLKSLRKITEKRAAGYFINRPLRIGPLLCLQMALGLRNSLSQLLRCGPCRPYLILQDCRSQALRLGIINIRKTPIYILPRC